MSTGASARAVAAGLIDDAAMFPPGNLALSAAVPAHLEHEAAWYGELVGPLLCADRDLPQLQSHLGGLSRPLRLALVVSGGAGAVEPAVTWVLRDPRLGLASVEVALRGEDDLARNARRFVSMLSSVLPGDVNAAVEVPRLGGAETPAQSWLAALDSLAESGHRLKYRTGGLEPAAFPPEAELAFVIGAALDRELAFKCTAGLHHAVRNTDHGTGFEQHGFLNVMVATLAALDGASHGDLTALLADRDRSAVAERVRSLPSDRVTAARHWFTSFGSCSVAEPVADLVELGVLSEEPVGA